MGVTMTAAGTKEKECRELPRDTLANANSKSKKNRRRQTKTTSPIQRLFETCKEVFSYCRTNVIPSPRDIERLKMVLGMSACPVIMDKLVFWLDNIFISFSTCSGIW